MQCTGSAASRCVASRTGDGLPPSAHVAEMLSAPLMVATFHSSRPLISAYSLFSSCAALLPDRPAVAQPSYCASSFFAWLDPIRPLTLFLSPRRSGKKNSVSTVSCARVRVIPAQVRARRFSSRETSIQSCDKLAISCTGIATTYLHSTLGSKGCSGEKNCLKLNLSKQ